MTRSVDMALSVKEKLLLLRRSVPVNAPFERQELTVDESANLCKSHWRNAVSFVVTADEADLVLEDFEADVAEVVVDC